MNDKPVEPMKAITDSGFLNSGSFVSPEGMNNLKSAMFSFARSYASKYFEGHIFFKDFDTFEKENFKSLSSEELS